MQKSANDIGNGKGMQLTMYAQVRLGCTIHIFIIGVDRSALKGCVESARRTENERRRMEADKTKCLAEEEEAGIMDIFIIGGRGKADGRQTKVVVVTSQRRRSAIPELRSNWFTLPPHNKY